MTKSELQSKKEIGASKKRNKKLLSYSTESVLQIVKSIVFVTNSIFFICPCKWNHKAQRFKFDESWFLTACRLFHLTGRCFGILVCMMYLLFVRPLTYVDLFVFIGGGLLLSASVSTNTVIWKSPDTFATVYNALMQLNQNCVRKDDIEQQLLLEKTKTDVHKVIKMTAILGCLALPFWLTLFRSNSSLIAIHITWLVMYISNLSEVIVHLVAAMCLSFLMYSEMLLWVNIFVILLLYASWGKACLRALNWNYTKLVRSDIKRYHLSFRQLQLVFGALNRRIWNNKEGFAFTLFERAACSFFVFLIVKIIQHTGSRMMFQFTAPVAGLAFVCVSTNLSFIISNLVWSVALESIEFRRAFISQQLRFNKHDRLFIRSCPTFLATLGGCLPMNNELNLKISKDFTLNLVTTLLLTYR